MSPGSFPKNGKLTLSAMTSRSPTATIIPPITTSDFPKPCKPSIIPFRPHLFPLPFRERRALPLLLFIASTVPFFHHSIIPLFHYLASTLSSERPAPSRIPIQIIEREIKRNLDKVCIPSFHYSNIPSLHYSNVLYSLYHSLH